MDPASANYHKLINLLSWLVPVTYLIHIAEEYWVGEGYPGYIHRMRGVDFPPNRFLVAQAIGFVLVTIGILVARRFNFPAMMLLILCTTLLGNTLTHSFEAVTTRSYNPGLVSSLLIWLPLGIFALSRLRHYQSSQRYWLAIAIGVGINVAIGVITMRGARFT